MRANNTMVFACKAICCISLYNIVISSSCNVSVFLFVLNQGRRFQLSVFVISKCQTHCCLCPGAKIEANQHKTPSAASFPPFNWPRMPFMTDANLIQTPLLSFTAIFGISPIQKPSVYEEKIRTFKLSTLKFRLPTENSKIGKKKYGQMKWKVFCKYSLA